jgi:hypothetical protein
METDVSIVLPKIPCGGFSPVRLQGWYPAAAASLMNQRAPFKAISASA